MKRTRIIKTRIINRVAPDKRVKYVIQQKHFLFRWWWVDAWINSLAGAACQDSFDSFDAARTNLCYFDGTQTKETIVYENKK